MHFFFFHSTLHIPVSYPILTSLHFSYFHTHISSSIAVLPLHPYNMLAPISRIYITTLRTFANETSQFLAPYDHSVKSRASHANDASGGGGDDSMLVNTMANSGTNYGGSNPGLFLPAAQTLHMQGQGGAAMSASISNAELTSTQVLRNNIEANTNNSLAHTNVDTMATNHTSGSSLGKRIEAWNPFEEQPFGQMTEDHIFEAEFDKIRQRGSQGSKSESINDKKCLKFIMLIKFLKVSQLNQHQLLQL